MPPFAGKATRNIPRDPLNPDGRAMRRMEREGTERLHKALLAYAKRIFKGVTDATAMMLPARAGNPEIVKPLQDAVTLWLIETAEAGVDFGRQQVEREVYGVKVEPSLDMVDWALPNDEAAAWALQYGSQLVGGITKTTANRLNKEVQKFVTSGETMPQLIKRLQSSYTFGASRAEAIAVTEVTKAYAQGNMAAWKHSGVVEKKAWRTATDEKVCPICSPLADEVRELDRPFSGGIDAPPAHVRCRCWIVPEIVRDVTPEGEIGAAVAPAGTPGFSDYAEGRRWAEENGPLDRQQAEAVRLYTSDDPQMGYRQMNGSLYTEIDGEALINLQPELKAQADLLSDSLSQLPRHEGKVYRGMNWSYAEDREKFLDGLLRSQELGEPARFPAFTSTTPSKATAKRFTSQRNGITFEIDSFNGRNVGAYSAKKAEKEVLFDKGTSFVVEGVTRERGYVTVKLREVVIP